MNWIDEGEEKRVVDENGMIVGRVEWYKHRNEWIATVMRSVIGEYLSEEQATAAVERVLRLTESRAFQQTSVQAIRVDSDGRLVRS